MLKSQISLPMDIHTPPKSDIRQASSDELKAFFESKGEKAFRAKQVTDWLWKQSVTDFAAMTNLSSGIRKELEERYFIQSAVISHSQKSADGTIKLAFKLLDGYEVEGVLIPTETRITACISSQVGCALGCKFCATGYMGRKRNLEPGEIYDQVVAIRNLTEKEYQKPLSNIVFMGMGEPLLNYANTIKAIEYITSPDGLNMASKRITVSTAGIAKMIKRLGDEEVKFNLALSLHAANDEKRKQIMPINESNTLEVLRDALKHYFTKTKNPVTYEYIVFHNFNDTLQDAEELYRFTKHVPSKVNIIEYNPIAEAGYVNTDNVKLENFYNYLKNKGVNVNIRRSRGKDIDAACGQLANKGH